MNRAVFKLLVSSLWPLLVHLLFAAFEFSNNRISYSSLEFVGVLLLGLLCLWHFLSRGVLPIIEMCCKHIATYEHAHIVSLYRRNSILFFPWRHYAEIKLSNEKTGLTWIGRMDQSICKDSRVKITFCRKSRYILSIETAEPTP